MSAESEQVGKMLEVILHTEGSSFLVGALLLTYTGSDGETHIANGIAMKAPFGNIPLSAEHMVALKEGLEHLVKKMERILAGDLDPSKVKVT